MHIKRKNVGIPQHDTAYRTKAMKRVDRLTSTQKVVIFGTDIGKTLDFEMDLTRLCCYYLKLSDCLFSLVLDNIWLSNMFGPKRMLKMFRESHQKGSTNSCFINPWLSCLG